MKEYIFNDNFGYSLFDSDFLTTLKKKELQKKIRDKGISSEEKEDLENKLEILLQLHKEYNKNMDIYDASLEKLIMIILFYKDSNKEDILTELAIEFELMNMFFSLFCPEKKEMFEKFKEQYQTIVSWKIKTIIKEEELYDIE